LQRQSVLRDEVRNIRNSSLDKRDGYEFLGRDENGTKSFAIYDLKCIREERPGFSPLSSKNIELATAAVFRQIKEVIDGNKEAVKWVAEYNFAGKTKHGNGYKKLSTLY